MVTVNLLAAQTTSDPAKVARAVATLMALALDLDIERLIAYRAAVQAGLFTDSTEEHR